MTTRAAETAQSSTKKVSRQAGVLYLLLAIMGIYNQFFLPSLLVSGDAEATARNIAAGEITYRLGIMSGFVNDIIFIFLAVSLYDFFKDIDKKQALLMLTLVLVGITIAFINLLFKFAPLVLLSGADYLSVFTKPQLDALVLGFLGLRTGGNYIVTAFWGLWLFPFGILVIKTGYIPKILGIMLIIAGSAYVVTSFTSIVLPAYRPIVSQVMMPLYVGEVPIIFWLLIKGARLPSKDMQLANLSQAK